MSSAFERLGHGDRLEKLSQLPLILVMVGYVALSGTLVWSFESPKEPIAPPERAVPRMEVVSPCPPSVEPTSCDVGAPHSKVDQWGESLTDENTTG